MMPLGASAKAAKVGLAAWQTWQRWSIMGCTLAKLTDAADAPEIGVLWPIMLNAMAAAIGTAAAGQSRQSGFAPVCMVLNQCRTRKLATKMQPSTSQLQR